MLEDQTLKQIRKKNAVYVVNMMSCLTAPIIEIIMEEPDTGQIKTYHNTD